MTERIIEIRSLLIEPEYVIDYSGYERRIKVIEERGKALELRYNPNHDEKTGRFTTSPNTAEGIDKSVKSGIIEEKHETADTDVHIVGKINVEIYKCVTEDIVTDEVIITDERIQHIKNRHPNDYERYFKYMKEIVEKPEYIIEANKPNSALILKSFEEEGIPFKTILRLVASSDNIEFKNSIITFMKINEKEWERLIKNKKILYKSE